MLPTFRRMETYNVEGAPFLGGGQPLQAMPPVEVQQRMEDGAVVLDVRSPSAFGGAHILGSYSVPLSLLSFTGWLIPPNQPIVTIMDDVDDLDRVATLARIGYDNVKGYLSGGLAAWYEAGYPLAALNFIPASELKAWIDAGRECYLLDVKSQDEFSEGHIASATNIYLGHLQERLTEVPRSRPIVVVCGTGARASIGASILLRNGYDEVYNFLGAMKAWNELEYPVTT